MELKIIILLVNCLFVNPILSANILFLSTLPSPSHHIWNKVLAVELVNRGHHVTMLTHENEDTILANFTIIKIPGLYEIMNEDVDIEDLANLNFFAFIQEFYDFSVQTVEYDFNSAEVKSLLKYPPNSYDLILYDISMGNSLLALAEHFNKAVVVAVTPFFLPTTASQYFGSPIYSSYMPFYTTKFTNVMNIKERLQNFIFTYYDLFYYNYIFLPKEEAIFKTNSPKSGASFSDAIRKITILLSNTDPVLEQPQPLPPNIIPVGGLQATPSKPLPKDLQKLMDEAKDGVIVFSLGTNVRSDALPLTSQQALLNAFSKLPQTVFWKFESDDLKNIPKNVVIQKWLPQNDMLGHPNTILLINHGGALSTQEALYHGVPLICIPFFFDQYSNMQRMIGKKVGLYLDKTELGEETIYQTIVKILKDPTYSKNVKSLSKKFRSQPQTPLQRAVFWIEHVLNHGDADHLTSRARDLSALELANLDVALVFLGCFLVIYFVCKQIFCAIRRLFKSKKDLKKLKKN